MSAAAGLGQLPEVPPAPVSAPFPAVTEMHKVGSKHHRKQVQQHSVCSSHPVRQQQHDTVTPSAPPTSASADGMRGPHFVAGLHWKRWEDGAQRCWQLSSCQQPQPLLACLT